jgi:diacylglycerol kinase (ATP)
MNLLKNIALLINPLHQIALCAGNKIAKLLQKKNIDHAIYTTAWPADFSDHTEVWVVGGDGTLNYFINHYPQFTLPMAIFKGGTGNDFHWMLYGDTTLEDQVEKVLVALPKPVDAGYCNNHLFLNGIGIGFDGKVVQDLLGKNSWSETFSYYKVVLQNILFFREFVCTVNNETFHWGKKCLMINIANGRRYGGSFTINPEGLINDKLLDVNIVGHVHPLMRVWFLKSIEKGTHVKLPMITYLKTGGIHIKTGSIIPAHADGEYFDASEFVIECLPARFSFLY